MNIIMYLCRELWREIWSFDSTYKKVFDGVVREIRLRFDDGRWWIRQSGLLLKNHRGADKDYFELNFLGRNRDYYLTAQFFKLQDVLKELNINRRWK